MHKIALKIVISCILIGGFQHTHAEVGVDKLIHVKTEPWQHFTNADGSGYFFDLLRAIYEPQGYQIKIEFCHWRACILDVIEAKADIILGVSAVEVEASNKLQRGSYPIHFERIAVAFKSKKWPDWQGQQTMKNKIIVQHKGFGHEKELTVPVKVRDSLNNEQAWHLLATDQADFFVDGLAVLEREVRQHNTEDVVYQIEPIFKTPNYMGFGTHKKSQKLLKVFNDTLPRLYQQGIPQALQEKWLLRWPVPLVKQ